MTHDRIEVNGRAATLADVRRVATFNYGHFTAMQFSDGGVRGLALHLERLDHATRLLFGATLPAERVRGYLARALDGVTTPASVRVNVFASAQNRDALAAAVEPDVLIALGPPARAQSNSIAVRTVRYARELPEVKHVGTFGLFHQRRLAQQAGYDDALFVTADDAISEGTIWNVAFDDGERIVWPEAPMLRGITQQVIERELARQGVPQVTRRVARAELARFPAAVAVNTALVAQGIARIDGVRLGDPAALVARLAAAHEAARPEPIAPPSSM